MPSSDVFFTSFRTKAYGDGIATKLVALARAAGIEALGLQGRYTALKLHFGERGNLSFLRPPLVRAIADEVARLGGKPFATDCNTLYAGSRKDALEHLETARLHGFLPDTIGCPVLIADGLKGTDDIPLPVPNGILLKEALVGRAIADADAIISLTHFKGHEVAGFGGAIKNLGMGCASRPGKKIQHSDNKPVVAAGRCVGCQKCAAACAHSAISYPARKAVIDGQKCVGCGRCLAMCPLDAIEEDFAHFVPGSMDRKMAEYAAAALAGKPHLHISFLMDISPHCDCHPQNDVPIVPDIGMMASLDPVALDQACVDAVNRQPRLPGTLLSGLPPDPDHFHAIGPSTDGSIQLAHAEKIGLGTRSYTLHSLDR